VKEENLPEENTPSTEVKRRVDGRSCPIEAFPDEQRLGGKRGPGGGRKKHQHRELITGKGEEKVASISFTRGVREGITRKAGLWKTTRKSTNKTRKRKKRIKQNERVGRIILQNNPTPQPATKKNTQQG